MQKSKSRRLGWTACLLLGSWLLGCATENDEAESYPARKIDLIVPFSPGGGTDTYARIFKQAIEQEGLLSQPLVVLNQGGAGGTIGSRRLKDAKPDGYTMMVLHDAILTAKLAGQVDYGPEAFEPIAATSEVGMVIAVREDSPHSSLKLLMQAAADTPDAIKFGANRGALTHFAGLQLEALAPGAQFRYAQIGGGAERFANLKAGHIHVTGFSIEEFARFRPDGLRGLCFFGAERHPAAQDVPTAKELGFPIVSRNTFYWWFPKGVPRDRVRYMESILQRAVQSPLVVEKLTEIHCQPIFVKGRALTQRLKASEADLASVNAGVDDPLPWLPWTLLGCAVFLAIGATVEYRLRKPLEKAQDLAAVGPVGFGKAALTLAMLMTYVLALGGGFDFRLATFAFVSLAGGLLSPRRVSAWLVAMLCALIVAYGVHFVFTDFFVIDLPSGNS